MDEHSLTTEHTTEHPILSKPVSFEKGPFRTYWENPSDYSVEEVSAALARVAEILRCKGYKLPDRAPSESESSETRFSPGFLVNLLALMEREPVLRSYLDAHRAEGTGTPDPLAAWAAASGDAVFLQTLKDSGWESYLSKLGPTLIIPLILIGVTAFLGNWIATALQQESFKHQKTFDVRLAGLQKGQDRAAELYTSISDVYSTIADAEDSGFTGLKTQKLRAEREKLGSIHSASRLYDGNGVVGNSMKDAEAILDNYIVCLDDKRQREQKNPGEKIEENCSQKFGNILVTFDKIIDAHTRSMNHLVQEP